MISDEKIVEMINAAMRGENVSYADDDMEVRVINVNPEDVAKKVDTRRQELRDELHAVSSELLMLKQMHKRVIENGDYKSALQCAYKINEAKDKWQKIYKEISDMEFGHKPGFDAGVPTFRIPEKLLEDIAKGIKADEPKKPAPEKVGHTIDPEKMDQAAQALRNKRNAEKEKQMSYEPRQAASPEYESFELGRCKLLVPFDMYKDVVTKAFEMHYKSGKTVSIDECVARVVLGL